MFLFTYSAAILSIICFGIAFYVIIHDHKNPLSRYFGLYVFFIAIFNGATAMADVSSTEANYRFWSGIVLLGGLFFIAFFICFTEYFTKKKPLTTTQQILIFTPAIIMSCLGFTRLLVDSVYFPANMPAQNTMGVLQYPILIYTFAGMSFVFSRLWTHIRNTTYKKKLQGIYITVGFLIVVTAAATFSVILPVFDEPRFFAIAPQFSIFMILLAAYAIFKHRLLNIKLIIQKSVIYLFLIFVVIGIYLLAISLLSMFAINYSSAYQPLAIIIAALLGATGVPILKKYLKRKTDKIFFKDHMPYSDAVHELSYSMNLNLGFNDLLNATTESLYKVFKPLKITIYLIKEKIICERECVPELKKIKIIHTDHFDILPDNSDKLYINAEHDGLVLAQIVIGEKISGDIYLPEDRSVLTTFSYQFAMALQKTQYFEKLKKSQKNIL